jgi:hypothetical protein
MIQFKDFEKDGRVKTYVTCTFVSPALLAKKEGEA